MHTKATYQSAKALTRVGCAVLRFNFRGVGRSEGTFDDGVGEQDDFRAGLDFMVKRCGFSGTGGAFVVDRTDTDGKFEFGNQLAAFAQAGFFLVPGKYEVAVRFARTPIQATEENQLEMLAGFNWFGAGHAWKIQTQAGAIHDTGDAGGTDIVVATQGQLVF